MSDQITEPTPTSVEPPWRLSAKGSTYCTWPSLPEDIKPQLNQQDRFGITLGQYHYNVKRNDDGTFVVFRSTAEEYEANKRKYSKNRLVEVQALPIEQANKLISTADDIELIGTDPVKIVNGEVYLIIGRKAWSRKESGSQ
jgi:hypothetical protein